MLFTIVFDEVGTLDTTDIKTAFQACELTHLVSAVLNAETKEVLYGELPDWMLSPEEAKARAEKEELARKRAWADKQARDALKISRPESKPAVKVKKVGGITRASASREQYDDAIIIPMAKEWAVLDRSDIGDHYRVMEFKDNAIYIFEQKTERKWCNRPFYDEVRLYHNGMLVRLSVNGHEFIF